MVFPREPDSTLGEFAGATENFPICKNDPNGLAHILRRVVQPPATFGVESQVFRKLVRFFRPKK